MTFNKINVLLDTWPYSGTTTTCDSLYMGTPVITMYNKKGPHSQNVSTSILSRVPKEFIDLCVCNTESDYINNAIKLIKNKKLLQWYQNNSRNTLKNIMNTENFISEYEKCLKSIL